MGGGRGRRTQAERSATTRAALLEAAARGLSTHGYATLSLERVAAEAGCSRGALYHQFSGKEDLVRAVVSWVDETWEAEVGAPAEAEPDALGTLLALARGHAVYCRRDVASVLMVLRVEFRGREHPVGRAVDDTIAELLARCTRLVATARAEGAVPAGPADADTADAYIAVLEAVGMTFAGRAPLDVEMIERAARGILGLS